MLSLKLLRGKTIALNTQEIENLISGNLSKELSGSLSKKDHGKYTLELTANECSSEGNFNINVMPDVQSSLNKILKENMKDKEVL